MSSLPNLLARALLLAALTPTLAAQAPVGTRDLAGHELAGLHLASGQAQALSLPSRVVAPIDVPARIDGVDVVLRLQSHSMRGSDFRLLVVDGQGRTTERTPPPVTTVRGHVAGFPGSAVAGRLAQGRLSATIVLAPGAEPWTIQPIDADDDDPPAAPAPTPGSVGGGPGNPAPGPGGSGALGVPRIAIEHAVYPASAVVDLGGTCGTPTFPSLSGAVPPPAAEASDPMIAEIACEADVPYYEACGSSVDDTSDDIEAIINGCEAIYLLDAGISYTITSILVRTSNDPYTTTDPGLLLPEFKNEWIANQSPIVRDVAHLFTGRNLDGSTIGIAYLGVICSSFSGYGLSESKFTGNLTSRIALTAHELGHNWNANHCNGDADCAIMCSGLGGCSGVVTAFGAASIAAIEGEKALASCLSDGTPSPDGGAAISTVSPDFGPSSWDLPVTVNGSGFADDPATAVLFNGVAGQVLSASDSALVVIPPPGVAGQRVDILVTGPTGNSLLEDGFTYEATLAPGNRLLSSLTSLDDIDRAYLEVPAGARLTASVRSVASDGLVPGLRLFDPDGIEVLLVEDDPDSPSGRARFKKLLLEETGLYRLEAFGVDGSMGAYRLDAKLKPDKKLAATVAVGPSTPNPTIVFAATAGSVLSKLTWKATPAKGAFATIEELPAALLPALLSIEGPSGPLDTTGLVSISPTGLKLALKGLPLVDFGDCTITLAGADGSVGYGKLKLKVKPPKVGPKTFVLIDPALE